MRLCFLCWRWLSVITSYSIHYTKLYEAWNDYETAPNSFAYDIEAQDAAGNWSVAETVTLNVTDVDENAPVVTTGQNLYYAENQVEGNLIGFVTATDDVAVTGFRFSDSVITSYSIHYTKLYDLDRFEQPTRVKGNSLQKRPDDIFTGIV